MRIPAGPSLRLDEVEPQRLHDIGSEAQRNLAYAYTYLASRQQRQLEPLVSKARERLAISTDFHELLARAERKSIAMRRPLPWTDLLLDTPRAIREALTAIVRRHHRLSTPVAKKALPGLRAHLYEHPDDRLALDVLRSIPGFDSVVKAVIDKFSRLDQARHMSSHMEVTPETMPEIYRLYRAAAEVLELGTLPLLYIKPGFLDAYTTGADRPIVTITQGVVSLLSQDEILFVLGHELGHVKSGHVLYTTMARWVGEIASVVGQYTLGLGSIVLDATLGPALNLWSRRAELTADRAGLLACQSVGAAVSSLAKLAGLPAIHYADFEPEDFVRQAVRLDESLTNDDLSRLATILDVMKDDHPRLVRRAAELNRWVSSGEFSDILDASKAQREYLVHVLGEDPLVTPFLVDISQAMATWAQGEFQCDRERASSECRRMIRLGAQPETPPLDKIFMVDVEVHWVKGGEVALKVHIVVLKNGNPVRVSLNLAATHAWSRLPAECREAFLRQNRPTISYRLYRKG